MYIVNTHVIKIRLEFRSNYFKDYYNNIYDNFSCYSYLDWYFCQFFKFHNSLTIFIYSLIFLNKQINALPKLMMKRFILFENIYHVIVFFGSIIFEHITAIVFHYDTWNIPPSVKINKIFNQSSAPFSGLNF